MTALWAIVCWLHERQFGGNLPNYYLVNYSCLENALEIIQKTKIILCQARA